MSYLRFIRTEFRFLLFGLILMLFCNLGQTYFIGLYSTEIRAAFNLTHSTFGGIYSAATLLSALVLFYSGPFIDRLRLAHFTALVVAGLGAACLLMGVAGSWVVFVIALFGIRHLGQGLCSHTAITAVSRAYQEHRASAVAVVQLGYAGGEATLPLATVWLAMQFGWQGGWLLIGALVLLVGLPALLYLAGNEPDWRVANSRPSASSQPQQDRAGVLRDRRFYLLLPLYTAPPFLLTGMFFHHAVLAAERGWSLTQLAQGFVLYALCKVVFSLLAGALVDRYSALRLFPLTALPLLLAFAAIGLPHLLPAGWALPVWLGFCGLCVGGIVPTSSSLWPELFGTFHLGAIHSLTRPIAILSTAIAPVLFALFIDAGISMTTLAWMCMAYLLLAALFAAIAALIPPPLSPPKPQKHG